MALEPRVRVIGGDIISNSIVTRELKNTTTGAWGSPQSRVNSPNNPAYMKVCEDYPGDLSDDLLIEQRTESYGIGGSILNGAGNQRWNYDDYWPYGSIVPNDRCDHIFSLLTQEFVNSQTAMVLARTNPSRPYVSLPTEIGELRELPSQIYDFGRQQFRKFTTGSNTAAVNFGVLPLVSTVLKLSKLSEETEKRNKVLKRLEEGKRRVLLPLSKDYTLEQEVSGLTNLQGPLVYTRKLRSTVNLWAVAHWIPDADYSIPIEDGPARRKEIRDLLLGVSKDKDFYGYLEDAWNLIPWSWLADWCSNMSDVIGSLTNQSIASSGKVWLCQTIETEETMSNQLGSSTRTRLTKQRFVGTPTGTAFTEPFSSKQVLILGSIISSRGKYLPRYD